MSIASRRGDDGNTGTASAYEVRWALELEKYVRP